MKSDRVTAEVRCAIYMMTLNGVSAEIQEAIEEEAQWRDARAAWRVACNFLEVLNLFNILKKALSFYRMEFPKGMRFRQFVRNLRTNAKEVNALNDGACSIPEIMKLAVLITQVHANNDVYEPTIQQICTAPKMSVKEAVEMLTPVANRLESSKEFTKAAKEMKTEKKGGS